MYSLKMRIDSVDGLTSHEIGTMDPAEVLKFCETYDKDGCVVTLTVVSFGEDAYRVLDRLSRVVRTDEPHSRTES
jgi:hypothetical protein